MLHKYFILKTWTRNLAFEYALRRAQFASESNLIRLAWALKWCVQMPPTPAVLLANISLHADLPLLVMNWGVFPSNLLTNSCLSPNLQHSQVNLPSKYFISHTIRSLKLVKSLQENNEWVLITPSFILTSFSTSGIYIIAFTGLRLCAEGLPVITFTKF